MSSCFKNLIITRKQFCMEKVVTDSINLKRETERPLNYFKELNIPGSIRSSYSLS